ncbi:hypothetical protein OAK04_00965 [Verrucomicrobia bacterium]|nr:hypothetical protein [Verrucomicrobiota bacterium]
MMILNRPEKNLWSHESITPCIKSYFDCYFGEINTSWISGNFPYKGKTSSHFRKVSGTNDVWTIRRDHGTNDLTADLFAVADMLGGEPSKNLESAAFGGGGVDAGSAWIALLDGGVGCEVHLYESERTNEVSVSRHRTTILGPKTYRAMTLMLGFEWSTRKLSCEESAPDKNEFISHLNDLIDKKNKTSF